MAFAPPRMRYTPDDLRNINRQFRSHCEDVHPAAAILEIEILDEDASSLGPIARP